MFCDSETIFSFQGPVPTRTVENGWGFFFFFQSGSVSVCEVTYSDKALGWEEEEDERAGRRGGFLPTPRDNGPDAQGGGSAEGPASQKALVLLIKRPSFAGRKKAPFSPPLPLLSPSILAKCWEKHIAAKTTQGDKCL